MQIAPPLPAVFGLSTAALLLAACSPSQRPTARASGDGVDHGRAAHFSSVLVARAQSRPEPVTTATAWSAAQFASAQVGRRYCWGGTGPSCFDCSGLVQTSWAQAGVPLPRTADAIASKLKEIALDEVRVGDILWWPGHVGLYVGSGWMVDALDTRHGVVRRPAADPRRAFRPPG